MSHGTESPFGGRCFVIAEIGLAHDGSLGMAHALVDAAATTGADAVKFQTHIAAAESTPFEEFRVPMSGQDRTRYEYWKRTEFSEEQWGGLARHAVDRGLQFLSSPFSPDAVDLLGRVGVRIWKIPSGEVTNRALLDRVADTGQPVLLSSGMSSLAELDAAVDRFARRQVPLGVLQCTTAYPCPPERVGLNQLAVLRARYACPVGLSDHSGTIYPGLAAAALGAEILEAHITLSRDAYGPDVPASLTAAEFAQLVTGVRAIQRMLENPVDKDVMAEELAPLRRLFTKSVVTRLALGAGTVLRSEHLSVKKPGTGIPADRLPELIGRRLRRAVAPDTPLVEADVEGL